MISGGLNLLNTQFRVCSFTLVAVPEVLQFGSGHGSHVGCK